MKTKKQKMDDLQVKRRHKLIIQEKTSTDKNGDPLTDEYGNTINHWNDWKTVTAQRLELFGTDYYAAKQAGEKKTIKWKIKYVASFAEKINTNDFRIVNIRTEEIFDIKDTDYLNDDGQWFIIMAEKSGDLNA